jgi:hypothetical protein
MRDFEEGGKQPPCRIAVRAFAVASVLLLAGLVAALAIRHRETMRRGNLKGVSQKNVVGPPSHLACSFRTFKVEDTIQSTALSHGADTYATYATNEEMNFGIDMAGLWWMKGNKLAEEFVSWKGSSTDTPNVFPMVMKAPTNLRGNWVWPFSVPGRLLMSYYASTEKPSVEQVLYWMNNSYATIIPIVGGGQKSKGMQFVLRRNMSDPSGDVWLRLNKDTPESPEMYVYTLVRVVNGDGTPNNIWWPKFEEYAKDVGIEGLYVWGNDNACMRSCEVAGFCWLCSWICGGR